MKRWMGVLACCLGVLISVLPARATGPEYKGYRDWVVEKNPDAKVPKDERIFVGYSNEWSSILSYEKDLDIRKLLGGHKGVILIYVRGHKSG